ncbi:class I SAM-dependent methyltransferase [Allonocardiopsis opalescens]|uniref:O-methyltransferase involved in polyketide biosynthesis n=1 Tax=Allonocardiopsis opalescens TaxID=1144618 RepID=A0A2T0Q4S3_9ACTN|nr:class I SAM-dependent methyltransferase [Allonocardiopsis opalescens]PRX98817.1 O-methyltransferase involved in polyketide biosynthesis [Allonocardiopsis opalescens]
MTARTRAPRLGAVQETMLIPLHARARETRKDRPLLRDPEAVRVAGALDYDFDKFGTGPSIIGSVLRSLVFDGWVRGFLHRHPGGTVVEIGAGLNTRFERCDNGRAHWVEMDLPDAMELRRSLFAESDRRVMVTGSAVEGGWLDTVARFPGPYLFTAEAVLLYLRQSQVRRALGLIGARFPGAWIALDTAGTLFTATQDAHDSLRHTRARVSWTCDDPAELEHWGLGLRLLASRNLAQPPDDAVAGAAPWWRALPYLGAAVGGAANRLYQMNLYRAEGADGG